MSQDRSSRFGQTPAVWRVVLAFAAIYVIWGSTYLAIRIAIETMPPLLMLGSRFAIAGLLLSAWTVWRGAPRPTVRQWRSAALLGLLMPALGTGGVAWAEQSVPSGLVALIVAAVPLFVVLIEWTFDCGRKRRFEPVGLLGVLAGFWGVALLIGGPGITLGWPLLVVLGGTLTWAVGSVHAKGADQAASPGLAAGLQMTLGGFQLILGGLWLGEGARLEPALFSAESLVAFVYLIVFGSIIAFSSYAWLLRVVSPSRVATYAYVNPVVALFLGWALADEPVGPRTLLAAAVILGSVALILVPRRSWLPEKLRARLASPYRRASAVAEAAPESAP